MKIAVFSDSHGSHEAMLDAVREYMPDQIIHSLQLCLQFRVIHFFKPAIIFKPVIHLSSSIIPSMNLH